MKNHVWRSLEYLKYRGLVEASIKIDKIPTLNMRNVKDNRVYYSVLSRLSQLFPDIIQLNFWNCKLTETVFKSLENRNWKIEYLVMVKCSFGNSIKEKLSSNMFYNLKGFIIDSDEVSNAGIKAFMKMNFRNLRKFALANTFCTSDIIKLLKKKDWPGFDYL